MEASMATAMRATDSSLLVGRSREQAVLREEMAVAAGGTGRLVLVGGEAGIGKTTLVRDLLRDAGSSGFQIIEGHCYDLTNIPPYGPWLDLFAACERNRDLPSPPDSFAGGKLARVSDQAALFAEVRRFFDALTVSGPAVVILEDLHWADPASADLLRHVGSHLRHWPVLLLATYRADELPPGRPFAVQFPALVRESAGRRLDLRRLDADALRALVTSRTPLAPTDEDRLVSYLERHADGNPFFATELLRTLEEEDLLREDAKGWELAALDRVIVPTLLRQVIDGRISRLGAETRKPLALAAVIGQEVPLDLWSKIAGLGEDEILNIIEQAIDTHLLEADRDGVRVRFVHALTREALYEGILPPRRRSWHRLIAEALMTGADVNPDGVAFHFQEAGAPQAWEWLIKAGDRAQRAYAWLTAAERLRAAAALLNGVEGQAQTRRELLLRIAYLLRFADPEGAFAALDETELLANSAGDAILAAEARYFRGIVLCYADRFRTGLEEMDRGVEALGSLTFGKAHGRIAIRTWLPNAISASAWAEMSEHDLGFARLHAVGLDILHCAIPWHRAAAGYSGQAAALAEQFVGVLASVPGATGSTAVDFTYHGLGIALAALGRPEDARQAWARCREGFREVDHFGVIALSLLAELSDVALTYGAADAGYRRRLAAEAEAMFAKAGGALRPGISPRLARLDCLVLDGHWEEALLILQHSPAPGNAYIRRGITVTRGLLGRNRGEAEVAWEQIRPLMPHGPATEPGDSIHQEGLFLQRLAAGLCLDARDLAGAHAWLAAHDAWLTWGESVLGRADGLLAWARYHQAAGETVRARLSLSAALTSAEAPEQPLVLLAALRLLGEIDVAAADFSEAESHLRSALDLADRCEAPFERALTLLALAELRAASGRANDALPLLDEAGRICTRMGAMPTLARIDVLATRLTGKPRAVGNPGGLTQRELDVLRLLVAGRSNPEIAEALFISRDTARTHVANIFRKLDVNSRAEAVDQAHRHGLLTSISTPST
jgi:DNA-binding CsgD family transcriptional regulator/tetratricopeptide (TPR) repeat protein